MILLRTKLFGFYDESGKLKEQFTKGIGKERFDKWKNNIINTTKSTLSKLGVNLKLTPEEIENTLRQQSESRDRMVKRFMRNSLEKSSEIKGLRDKVSKFNSELQGLKGKLKNLKPNSKEAEKLQEEIENKIKEINALITDIHSIKNGGSLAYSTIVPSNAPKYVKSDNSSLNFRRTDTTSLYDDNIVYNLYVQKKEELDKLVKNSIDYLSLAKQLKESEAQIKELKSLIKLKEEYERNLESHLETVKGNSDKIRSTLQDTIETLQKHVKFLKEELEKIRNQNSKEIQDLENQLQQKAEELEKLSARNSKFRNEIEDLENSNRNLKWGIVGTSILGAGGLGFGIAKNKKEKEKN